MRLRTEVGQIIFRHQNTATKGKEETLQPLLVVSKSDEHCKPLPAHEQELGMGFDCGGSVISRSLRSPIPRDA